MTTTASTATSSSPASSASVLGIGAGRDHGGNHETQRPDP